MIVIGGPQVFGLRKTTNTYGHKVALARFDTRRQCSPMGGEQFSIAKPRGSAVLVQHFALSLSGYFRVVPLDVTNL